MGQAERTKGRTWLQALWLTSDLLAIAGGFLLGYWVRFHSPLLLLFPVTKGVPPLSLYAWGAVVTVLIWIPLMHAAGLYRVEHLRPRHRAWRVLRVQALGMLAVAAVSAFYRDATYSRLAAPFIWVSSSALTLAGRALIGQLLRRLRLLRPIRFAVVGEGEIGLRLARRLEASAYPHVLAGSFRLESAEQGAEGGDATGRAVDVVCDNDHTRLQLLPVLGNVREIRARGAAERLDMIALAAAAASPALVQEVFAQCQELDLDFVLVPDLFSMWARPVRVEEIDGLAVIRLRDMSLVGWNGVLKRTFDLVVSALLLLLLLPVFLVLAAAVRLDSRGPVFHRQERVGRDRRRFDMVKFRSMKVGAEAASGPVWASQDDPRRTRLGVFLRKWSLDELPQLWNVLRGEMSLVGPRPERPFFVDQFESRVADYYDRHRVKSGITGWAQVHGLRGETPIEERTRYDLFYVENWSIWLDIRILARTVLAIFRHRGA